MCFFPPSYLGWLCGFACRVDPVLRRGREKGVLRTSPKRVPEEDASETRKYRETGDKSRMGKKQRIHSTTLPQTKLANKALARLTRCWLGVGSAKNPIKNFKTLSLAGRLASTHSGWLWPQEGGWWKEA